MKESTYSNSNVDITEAIDPMYASIEQNVNSINNEKYLKFVEHINEILRDSPEFEGTVSYHLKPLIE